MLRKILVTAAAVAVLIAGVRAVSPAAPVAAARNLMPVAQQNALIQKYCAVCHEDAHMNGGLSLQHFDAAKPDPGVAAMIVSKLNGKAMGAAGIPLPDKATQDALLEAMSAETAGADRWIVSRNQNSPILTASVVRQVPSANEKQTEPDLYRLTLTCNGHTREAGMQLAWSPGVPKDGQVMSAAVDGKAAVNYKIEGSELMANGQAGTSGPGAIMLKQAKLPKQTLTVSNVFADERIVFPFDGLPGNMRKSLSACFSGRDSGE
jgi:hypothetical protein